MDPTQQNQQPQPVLQPAQTEQQEQRSATDYYDQHRKRSFLLSRVTVVASMLVLVIALGVNLFALAMPNTGTIKSNAYSPENPEKNLPSLPKGCSYQNTPKGLTVSCPTTTPANKSAYPVSVVLPKLPPACNFAASASGSVVSCASPNVPIPTTGVTLPVNCTTTPQANVAACKNNDNKIVAVPLPSLPGGCSYAQQGNNDYVVCEAK